MATFVTSSASGRSRAAAGFRVTSTRDPSPLIGYHNEGWSAAYIHSTAPYGPTTPPSGPGGSGGGGVGPAAGGGHETRASVIMKTSDVQVTSS